METGLRLLMRDGAIRAVFYPRLTSPQYDELLAVVERSTTKDELRSGLELLARKWDSRLEFEE